MKYIKKFNESIYNNNEMYIELVEILQTKLFDDYDIVSGTSHEVQIINNSVNSDEYPEYKFWLFKNTDGQLVYSIEGIMNTTSKPLYSTSIIKIYNIPEDEHIKFFNELKKLTGLVDDIFGKELIFQEYYIKDVKKYDYIISLDKVYLLKDGEPYKLANYF
jgi:hypothetical protein